MTQPDASSDATLQMELSLAPVTSVPTPVRYLPEASSQSEADLTLISCLGRPDALFCPGSQRVAGSCPAPSLPSQQPLPRAPQAAPALGDTSEGNQTGAALVEKEAAGKRVASDQGDCESREGRERGGGPVGVSPGLTDVRD